MTQRIAKRHTPVQAIAARPAKRVLLSNGQRTPAPRPCTLDERCNAINFLKGNVTHLCASVVSSVGSAPDVGALLVLLVQSQEERAAAGAPLVSGKYFRMAEDHMQRLRAMPVPLPLSWRMANDLPRGNEFGDFLRSDDVQVTFEGFNGIAEARKSQSAYCCNPSEVSVAAVGKGSGARIEIQKTGRAHAKAVAAHDAARQEAHALGDALNSFQRTYAECRDQYWAPPGGAAAGQPAQAACTSGVLQKRCSNTPEEPGAKRTKFPVARC